MYHREAMARMVAFLLTCACLASQQTAFGAEAAAVRLRWADAAEMIRGQRVAIATTGGRTVKGRVHAIEPDAIIIEKGKTPRIERADIAEIQVTRYTGNGRHFGKLIGGMVGLMVALIGAAAIGLKEGSGHRTSDKVLLGLIGLGGFPAGLLGGYYLGQEADKEVTVIHIIAE